MLAAQKHRQPDHALDADRAHLDALPVLEGLDERNKTAVHEIDIVDRRICMADRRSLRQIDGFQIEGKPLGTLPRQGRQDAIVKAVVGPSSIRWHDFLTNSVPRKSIADQHLNVNFYVTAKETEPDERTSIAAEGTTVPQRLPAVAAGRRWKAIYSDTAREASSSPAEIDRRRSSDTAAVTVVPLAVERIASSPPS